MSSSATTSAWPYTLSSFSSVDGLIAPPHLRRDRRYRFTDEGSTTLVELTAEVELGGLAGALGPLASRAVKRGVDSNSPT